MARNENAWLELHDVLEEHGVYENEAVGVWLTKLEEATQLREIDLMRLTNLVDAAIRAALSNREEEQ